MAKAWWQLKVSKTARLLRQETMDKGRREFVNGFILCAGRKWNKAANTNSASTNCFDTARQLFDIPGGASFTRKKPRVCPDGGCQKDVM
jgi:hypothetical protein